MATMHFVTALHGSPDTTLVVKTIICQDHSLVDPSSPGSLILYDDLSARSFFSPFASTTDPSTHVPAPLRPALLPYSLFWPLPTALHELPQPCCLSPADFVTPRQSPAAHIPQYKASLPLRIPRHVKSPRGSDQPKNNYDLSPSVSARTVRRSVSKCVSCSCS